MSRSLHHIPGRLDWPGTSCDVPSRPYRFSDGPRCRRPLEAHDGGRCPDRGRDHRARVVGHDGTVATRRAARSYVRRYYRPEVGEHERLLHRRVRRRTRVQLGLLAGPVAVAVEVADGLLLDDPGRYDVAYDVV